MYFPYHDVPGVYDDRQVKLEGYQAKGFEFEVGVAFGGEVFVDWDTCLLFGRQSRHMHF